jgi:hypothetical protein
MPARSVVVQLQPGVGQAILPDHRKMLPGIQYVIDWETFDKISNGARQNVIQVVSIQTDSSDTYTVAQTSNANPNFNDILNMSWPSFEEAVLQIAGFAAQGAAGDSLVGLMDNVYLASGAPQGLKALTSPDGARYLLASNVGNWSAGDVLIWEDETRVEATPYTNEETFRYIIRQDGQGTPYQVPTFRGDAVTGGHANKYSTLRGGFAGVAVTANSSYRSVSWIQIEGFCPLVNTGTNVITAGATLSVDADNQGTAKAQPATPTVVSNEGVITGSAQANNVFGTALTAADGSGTTSVQADIRSVTKVKKPYVRFLNKN